MSSSAARRMLGAVLTFLLAALMIVGNETAAQAVARHDRIAGADRYATSAMISRQGNPTGAPTVYLASGESFPDALAAGAAAGMSGAPVLLTRAGGIPEVVRTELARLNPSHILLVGGDAALSDTVKSQAEQVARTVTRVSGSDRYATAAALAQRSWSGGSGTVYLASGQTFADALAASAAAGHKDSPILLTSRDALPDPTRRELARLGAREIIVVGGTAAISDSVVTAVRGFGSAIRIAGADRYATSAAIATHSFGRAAKVLASSGTNFPDALAGAALAAKQGAPVALVPSSGATVPASVCSYVMTSDPRTVTALGGVSAVTDGMLRNVALGCPKVYPSPQCTSNGIDGMDEAAARSAAAGVVSSVAAIDAHVNSGAAYGLAPLMLDLQRSVAALQAAGVPDVCQQRYYEGLMGLVRADVDQAVFDASIYDRSVASYRIARANLKSLMTLVSQATGATYRIP